MGYQKVCWVDRCPEETCIRVAEPDGKRRRDMCIEHGLTTVWYYGDKIVVQDFWGRMTQELITSATIRKPVFEYQEDNNE